MGISINGRQIEITSTIREWVGDRRDMTVESISALTATLVLASVGPCIT